MRNGLIRAAAGLASLTGAMLVVAPGIAQVAPSPVAALHAPDARAAAARIDEYLKAAIRNDHFSGSILVARDGVPIVSKGYGMANYELNVPNSPQTVFVIGSLTKQFTATAILHLQERGKLKVSDPICKYLDDCPPAWASITIRHLLTHTSGIRNMSSLPDWDEKLAIQPWTPAALVSLFRDLPLEFVPGEKFEYSNSGYHLLGLIVERASGKAYGQYLRDAIFAPTGMTHTCYDISRALVPNRATGYYSLGTEFVGAPYMNPTASFANGGIRATTGDLLRWDQALYTDKLLSKASRDAMFTPYKDGYGFGWQIGERFGRARIDHGGSENGFSSYILRFPADRVTVIVLSNSDATSATRIAFDLGAIVFGAPYKPPVPKLGDVLWDTIASQGIGPAIRQYRDLKRARTTEFDFSDETLLDLGYALFEGRRLTEAAAIFRLNLETFPRSAYSYDGLADIAALQGDRPTAIAHFEKSLTLDPANRYAIEGLAKLRKPAPK